MRFGKVLLGLVTLASLHISRGEHSLGWVLRTCVGCSMPWQRFWDHWPMTWATRDSIAPHVESNYFAGSKYTYEGDV